jgi:hypothetical protein
MTRFAAIVLALSLTAGGALAASPEADYLEARDKAIAEVKALENSKASQSAIDAAMDKALADLTKRLKDIVGPVSIKGFPGAGRLNLLNEAYGSLDGSLDGVAYDDQGSGVVVTTRSLLTAWLEGKAKDEDKESRLPTDVEAAVRQENFYTLSFGGDAAIVKFADLPVTKPAGAALAVAALGLIMQGTGYSPPDTIVATVVKGDRVFVASIPRTAPIGKIPACDAILTESSRKADKLQAEYDAEDRASGLKNKKLFDEISQAQDQGYTDARACFNARAPKQSFFAGLTKEAQSLVDRLAPDRVQAGATEPAKSAAPPVEHVPSPPRAAEAINDYPERLAEFQKDQTARRKEAEEVDFSEVKPEDIKKSYPFLYDPDDIAPTFIAESRGKMNLLFVIDTGLRYCGSGGCGETVYVDEGAGYKAAFDALTQDHDPVYVTRTGGQVFLYFGPPNIISQQANGLPVELILRDHKFVDNPPPPPPSPPPSSASVPSIPVRWYEGMDAPGSDFGPWLFSVANAEDCIRLCAQDSGCVGVTYNIRRSVCIRKTGIRSLNYTRDAATTGVLTDRTPAPDALAGPTPHTGLGIATTVNAASPPAALPGTPEASAKPTNSMPSGPAAQAILRWFTTDRSLGCSDQQLNDSACTIGLNMLYGGVTVYYGDSTGDGPQADALAFLYYDQGPTQNGTNLAIAYFHRDGGNYRFIKTFPDITGDMMQSTPDEIVKGATVQFLPGRARFSMVVHRDTDALCCPTGRANYTVTLNPTSPAPRVRHYENVDAPGNNRGNWIRGVSSADCESICIADSGCAGYTYNRSRATCIPKSIVVRLMSSSEPAVTGVVEGR